MIIMNRKGTTHSMHVRSHDVTTVYFKTSSLRIEKENLKQEQEKEGETEGR